MTPYNRIAWKRIGKGYSFAHCAIEIKAEEDALMQFEGGNFSALSLEQIQSYLQMLDYWPWEESNEPDEEKDDLVGLVGQIQAAGNIEKGIESVHISQDNLENISQSQIVKKKKTRRGKENRPGKGNRGSDATRQPRPLGIMIRPITLEDIQKILPEKIKSLPSQENEYNGELVYCYKGDNEILVQIFTGFKHDGQRYEKASSIRISVSDFLSSYKVIQPYSGRLPLGSPKTIRALKKYLSIIISEISERHNCMFCQNEMKLKSVFKDGIWKEIIQARKDKVPGYRRPKPIRQLWKCIDKQCIGSRPIHLLPILFNLRLSIWEPMAVMPSTITEASESNSVASAVTSIALI